MSQTDIITFILSLFFIFRGYARGFMRTMLVPFSIIAATFISIIYYQITKDWVLLSLIELICPFLLHSLFKFLLKKWAKATNTEIKPNVLSQLSGLALNLIWGWIFIIFALILLAVLPPWGEKFNMIRNNVAQSASYYCIAKPVGKKFFTAVTTDDPSLGKNILAFFFPETNKFPSPPSVVISKSDAQSLSDDPRFKIILQDPEIQREIDAHDFVTMMSNPKIIDLTQQILHDPATLKKVMSLYSNQNVQQANWAPSEQTK